MWFRMQPKSITPYLTRKNKRLLTSWTVLSQIGWAANHSITPGSPWPPPNNLPWWCARLWFSHAHLCPPTSSLQFPCGPSGLIQLIQIKQIQLDLLSPSKTSKYVQLVDDQTYFSSSREVWGGLWPAWDWHGVSRIWTLHQAWWGSVDTYQEPNIRLKRQKGLKLKVITVSHCYWSYSVIQKDLCFRYASCLVSAITAISWQQLAIRNLIILDKSSPLCSKKALIVLRYPIKIPWIRYMYFCTEWVLQRIPRHMSKNMIII